MTPIRLIAEGIDVRQMQQALADHPELWDQQTARTAPKDSPHHGLSDIWARYADPKTVREDGSHDSIWYPCADQIPVRELVYPLMTALRGDRLGGVLITRIKPGQVCKPHTDPGWHARYYDKYAIQIQANSSQAFHFENVSLVTKPGDVYAFDNSHLHWVTNESDSDRVTLIACIKTERSMPCLGE